MLDKNEAPEGYEAVEGRGTDSDCQQCCFFEKSLKCTKHVNVISYIGCVAFCRNDKTPAYFIRKATQAKEYECWAYIGKDGRICADNDFMDEARAWFHMLGWPDNGQIEAAKARGDRVVKVKITEIE